MTRSSVSIVRCGGYDPDEVEAAVRRAVGLLGGIEKFVRPNSKVLIKPNLLSARRPEEGVDTHPEVLRAVARLLKPVASRILVGDSPGGWALKEIDSVYEKSGAKEVCQQEGLELVKFDKAVYLDGFPIAAVAREVDSIVSIPKLKTHSTNILTGAVKNTFGVVVGMHKAQCHFKAPLPHELAIILVRIFGIATPALSIMDGIVGMEGEGPAAGSLRDIGLILAGGDAVSLDAVFSKIAGVEPLNVPTTAEAVRRNMGIGDLNRIDVVGEKIEKAEIKNFKLPQTARIYKLPRPLIRTVTRRIKFYPFIDRKKCLGCALCFNSCPAKTIKPRGAKFRVETKGCVNCFCCHEVCPYNAIKLRKSFLAKFIIKG
ncbi:MAG: DUF362 domain-containing protein [Candidatus Omnitrophica bacterium]|nr:DUF362 domain-containing protein [Candidatus Omnitrophota bacterium]